MAGSRWCRECGAENSTGAAFCKACGRPLDNPETHNTQQANTVAADSSQNQNGEKRQDSTQPSYGFQSQTNQDANQFQTKPKLKPENSAGLGFLAYASVVVLIIGVILFFFGQQQVDTYSGFPWYEPYESKAQLGSILRICGVVCSIGGIIGLVRYFISKK